MKVISCSTRAGRAAEDITFKSIQDGMCATVSVFDKFIITYQQVLFA